MTPKDELSSLEKQLSALYLTISEKYKLMSRASDNHRLDAMQSGIDHLLEQSRVLREKIDALRKEIMDQWNRSEKGGRF